MDSNNSLATRCLKLPPPKPINGSFSSFKTYEKTPISNSTNTFNTASFIPQQTLNVYPIGKTLPNKRGRKPLTTMPVAKKHVQNLTNQRAFRQRKENYLRNLESKVFNLELLYSAAQNEIRALKDKVTMLEKKLASSNPVRNGGIVGSTIYQAIVDNQNTIYAADEPKNNDINDPFTNSNDRNLSSYTPVTTVSSVQLAQLKENAITLSMPQQMSKRKSIDSNTSSIESVGDIDILNSIASANKYTGERIWLDSTSPLYPAFVSDSSQTRTFPSTQDAESQWQSNHYFDQEQPTIATTVGTSFSSHHPLNLKWILTPQNEE